MSKNHKISKFSLAYYSKFTPWKKRAARGHERAAQKRSWQEEEFDYDFGPWDTAYNYARRQGLTHEQAQDFASRYTDTWDKG